MTWLISCRGLRFLAALALVVSVGAPAAGAPTIAVTPEKKQEMKEHYERATRAFDVGKFADAIEEYGKVYEIGGDPAMLFNIAQSHRLNNQPADAVRFYRRYLQRAPRAPNRADVEQKIADLEKTLDDRTRSGVTTPPPSPSAPAAQPSPNPSPSQLPPAAASPPPGALGPAPVTVPAPGSTASTAAPVTVTPSPGASPPLLVTPPPPGAAGGGEGGNGRFWVLASLGAIGATGFLLAIIEGNVARDKASKISAQSKQGGVVFDPAVETNGQRANAIAITAGLVGTAALITGGIIYFVGGRSSLASQEAGAQPAPRVSVAPVMGPGNLVGAAAAWSY